MTNYQYQTSQQSYYQANQVSGDERILAALCHFLQFWTFFIGPLVVWAIGRDRNPFVDQHGRAALNFSISLLIYSTALLAVSMLTFGLGLVLAIPVLLIGALVYFVATVIGGIRALQGEMFEYPLTIKFL